MLKATMNQAKRKEKKLTKHKAATRGIDTALARFQRTLFTRGLNDRTIRQFRQHILNHFEKHGRIFPWRQTSDPYRILVSEIMLQQTQVDRVIEKYEEFLAAFPDILSLADASLQEVLNVWLGLGYNRRAVHLKKCAEQVAARFGGKLPANTKELRCLPGIGAYTAAAIGAFAFNQPVVLLETNVRTVFIHFFFFDRTGVKDREIIPLVEKTLDRNNPRDWYNALMDYGAMLKKLTPNPGRKSAHYTRQSPFEGSDRQVRGMILRMLTQGKEQTEQEIIQKVGKDPERTRHILSQLEREQIIKKEGASFTIG